VCVLVVVLGALVGAIPPLMGYAAATGGDIAGGTPIALASLLFLWQFPHFFALSWLHREDYARGGFQMVAVNDPTGSRYCACSCTTLFSLLLLLTFLLSLSFAFSLYTMPASFLICFFYLFLLLSSPSFPSSIPLSFPF
jgi:heme O synthase-like polyprenyltransferase